jgi:hypothetical protein
MILAGNSVLNLGYGNSFPRNESEGVDYHEVD